MRIYLFRHGEALPKDDPSVSSDAERPLVEEGIRRTHQAATGLKTINIPFDAVFTSPWLRAFQTAQIVCEVLELGGKPQVMEELAGDRTIEETMRALAKHPSLGHVMLVGHNPLLSDLASYLLSLTTNIQIDLKKSGICVVEVERVSPRNPGKLVWMMTAKHLRALR